MTDDLRIQLQEQARQAALWKERAMTDKILNVLLLTPIIIMLWVLCGFVVSHLIIWW